MIGPRNKLIAGILVIAAIMAVSIFVLRGMGFSLRASGNAVGQWTPPPSDTPEPTVALHISSTDLPSQPDVPTPTLNPSTNCTRTADFWAAHPDKWPVSVAIGDFVYTKGQALTIIKDARDISGYLFVELNAAYLNANYGADYSSVKDSILAAASWLNSHPPGSDPSLEDQQIAVRLVITLADFNTGRAGPGLCNDSQTTESSPPTGGAITTGAGATFTATAFPWLPPTPTPDASATSPDNYPRTPTASPSPTVPTPTQTPIPSFTATTFRTPTPAPTITQTQNPNITAPPAPNASPTRTPTATRTATATFTPTRPPTATRTATATLNPTKTPLPPTSTPVPTNTPQPTSTPVPTNTPQPTSAPAPTDTPQPTSPPAPTDTLPSPTLAPAASETSPVVRP